METYHVEELAAAFKLLAESTRPTAEEYAKIGIEINNMSNKPKTEKEMKVKEYFISLGRAALVAPFMLAGLLLLAVSSLLKSAGFCLVGDFKSAKNEIDVF